MWHDLALLAADAGPDDAGHFGAVVTAITTITVGLFGLIGTIVVSRRRSPSDGGEPAPGPTPPAGAPPAPSTITIDAGWGQWAQGELNRVGQELATARAEVLRLRQFLQAAGLNPDTVPPLHHSPGSTSV